MIRKLRNGILAIVFAWAANTLGSTIIKMEVHMDANVVIEVHGEAGGRVGLVGNR